MANLVTLRKSGNSLVLTVPADFKSEVGRQYMVNQRADGSILYQPVGKKNIFDDSDWVNYDYQWDLKADSELQLLKPVEKERLD